MIELYVDPQRAPLTWADFRYEAEPFSIALDGYVAAGPRYDPERKLLNLNHHEDVDRLATRATCGQVLISIRQGLFKVFRRDNAPMASVMVNDCDEDVCTSWYLLKNHVLAESILHPRLNRLVMLEDMLDTTAGAYPFPTDLQTLGEMSWVFEPYRQFRIHGGLGRQDTREFRAVIEDVEGRIGKHIMGYGGCYSADTRYERIGGGPGWTMVKEIGAQARSGMFSDGIVAYVAAREIGEGRWSYVVGRSSHFIPFDCRRIYRACNEAEGIGDADCWNGSDSVGGSPRVRGSRLTPTDIERIVNEAK